MTFLELLHHQQIERLFVQFELKQYLATCLMLEKLIFHSCGSKLHNFAAQWSRYLTIKQSETPYRVPVPLRIQTNDFSNKTFRKIGPRFFFSSVLKQVANGSSRRPMQNLKHLMFLNSFGFAKYIHHTNGIYRNLSIFRQYFLLIIQGSN